MSPLTWPLRALAAAGTWLLAHVVEPFDAKQCARQQRATGWVEDET